MTGLWDRRSSRRDLEQPCLVSLSSAIESSASYSLPNELTQRFNDERERERNHGKWGKWRRLGVRRQTPGTWRDAEPQITRLGQTGDGDSENRDVVYCITIAHHTIIYYSGCFKTNIPIIQRTYCIIYRKSVPIDVSSFSKNAQFSEVTSYLGIFRLFSEGLRIWHLPCYYKLAA